MNEIEALFSADVTELDRYVNQAIINDLAEEFASFCMQDPVLKHKSGDQLLEEGILFLLNRISKLYGDANDAVEILARFRMEIGRTGFSADKQHLILTYAERLGATSKELHDDETAFRRWFDEDAMSERAKRRISDIHRRLGVCIDRIGVMGERLFAAAEDASQLWNRLQMNQHATALLVYQNEPRIVEQAFSAVAKMLKQLDLKDIEGYVDPHIIHFVYKATLSDSAESLIRIEALKLLSLLSKAELKKALRKVLKSSVEKDIFVRHHAAVLAVSFAGDDEEYHALAQSIHEDESPYVRQGMLKGAVGTPAVAAEFLTPLLFEEEDTSVKVKALEAAHILAVESESAQEYQTLLLGVLAGRHERIVVRAAMEYLFRTVQAYGTRSELSKQELFVSESMALLEKLHSEADDVAVKRYGARYRELLWACRDQESYDAYVALVRFVKALPLQKYMPLPSSLHEDDFDAFLRRLSAVAQSDFTLQVRQGIFGGFEICRKEFIGRRIWRIAYELLHPSPDKREAAEHTVARHYTGRWICPSALMAEMAPTEVPGEPLYIDEEEDWRPYLPLPDHFISALDQPTLKNHEVQINSAEGITLITPPATFWQRRSAQWKMLLQFKSVAKLRNWRETAAYPEHGYIDAFKKMGFGVRFRSNASQDRDVQKFFPAVIPFEGDLLNSMQDYFISLYENSLVDIILFMAGVFILFFARHYYLSKKIAKARRNIPLVIGGWGTRGKSGTERLKAALFNSLGLRTLSKTTGCEAMFLYADRYDKLNEVFLYRPYDKATIWEQNNVMQIADAMEVDVFLWECMALTPAYVDILQHRWMHDDLSTITNAYPDHENLQGPAGYTVAESMTQFIPKNARLIMTEELMSPVLEQGAAMQNSPVTQAGWLEAAALAPDIMSRFTYEEHPYNVVLVLELAKALQISEERALKAMLEYVVPDIGVLKIFPEADVGQGRELEFINSMSANERYGTLSNWKRLGLERPKDSRTMITAFVNNRADRVSRSNVFASILVNDIVAELYLLAGTNVNGLQSYIDTAWHTLSENLQLDDAETAAASITRYAKHFRVPMNASAVTDALLRMLDALSADETLKEAAVENIGDLSRMQELLAGYDDVLFHFRHQWQSWQAFEKLMQHCSEKLALRELEPLFKATAYHWLEQRIVIVENEHATAHEVLEYLVKHTPPGMYNRVVGLQNIKGIGLELVYLWAAWERCFEACRLIRTGDEARVVEGLRVLADFREHSRLTLIHTEKTLAFVEREKLLYTETMQSEYMSVKEQLEAKQRSLAAKKISPFKKETLVDRLFKWAEAFMDAGDAVRRRKQTDRIYRELIEQRISTAKAATEVKKVVKRQEQGWSHVEVFKYKY